MANGPNRLASVTTAAGTRSIAYDNRGNTIGEIRPGGASVSASYDGYGRLLTYDCTGDPTQANAYNRLDDRVSASSGGVVRRFVYDHGGRVFGEHGVSAADVIAETIWLSPEVAANDNQPFGGVDGVGGYAPLAVATGSGAGATITLDPRQPSRSADRVHGRKRYGGHTAELHPARLPGPAAQARQPLLQPPPRLRQLHRPLPSS